MANNDNDDGLPEDLAGYAVRMPTEIVEALQAHHAAIHEREHMLVESLEQRMHNFLDNLDVEGLLILRKMLQGGPDLARHLDGQIVSILRVVHHVNSEGKSHAEVLAEGDASKEEK